MQHVTAAPNHRPKVSPVMNVSIVHFDIEQKPAIKKPKQPPTTKPIINDIVFPLFPSAFNINKVSYCVRS